MEEQELNNLLEDALKILKSDLNKLQSSLDDIRKMISNDQTI